MNTDIAQGMPPELGQIGKILEALKTTTMCALGFELSFFDSITLFKLSRIKLTSSQDTA